MANLGFRFQKNTPVRESYLLNKGNAPFSITEAYKALRTNVLFSLPQESQKVIGVTSSERGDGKTTTAINLALSLCEVGKSVILLECDFRLPTLVKKTGIRTVRGFSDMLIGSVEKEKVIKTLPNSKLNVLPAGRIPKDPTALLQSSAMKEFIEECRSTYDYIVVDLPPVNVVADALIMSEFIDGFLLVIRHGVSEFNRIQETIKRLEISKANIIGFAYNGSKLSEKKYYSKYKYGYEYKAHD